MLGMIVSMIQNILQVTGTLVDGKVVDKPGMPPTITIKEDGEVDVDFIIYAS